MKSFITSIATSLVLLYVVVAFISLTPNVVEWEAGGRGAYIFFGLIIGIAAWTIQEEINKSK